MLPLTMATQPTSYEIRVEGRLDAHWAAWLDGVVLAHDEDATTLT